MTVKLWPMEFVNYHTGALVGREWFRPGEGMYDEVEATAATLADVNGIEVDIYGCSVMPSGRIGSRERLGMRVRPSMRIS